MSALLPAADVANYFEAVEWLTVLLQSDEVDGAWPNPSALTRMSVGAVAAHAVHGGVLRLEQQLEEEVPIDRRRVEIPEFYGPNRMESPEDDDRLFVALREQAEKQAARGRSVLLAECARSVAVLHERLPRMPADRAVSLIRVPDGQSPLSDCVRTRILELVVHGDDIAASIPDWAPPEPPADAVRVCLALCVELAEARSGGMGALRSFARSERAAPGALRVL